MSERRPVVMIASFALVALILVGAAVYFDRGRSPAPASGPLSVELHGMVAIGSPPQIVRSFASGGKLQPGESLLLRGRLSRPAYLTLLAQRPGSAAEPIWPDMQSQHEAGEFELGEGDQLLALTPSLFPAGATLSLIACEAPLEESRTRIQEPLAAASFPGCTKSLLPIAGLR